MLRIALLRLCLSPFRNVNLNTENTFEHLVRILWMPEPRHRFYRAENTPKMYVCVLCVVYQICKSTELINKIYENGKQRHSSLKALTAPTNEHRSFCAENAERWCNKDVSHLSRKTHLTRKTYLDTTSSSLCLDRWLAIIMIANASPNHRQNCTRGAFPIDSDSDSI